MEDQGAPFHPKKGNDTPKKPKLQLDNNHKVNVLFLPKIKSIKKTSPDSEYDRKLNISKEDLKDYNEYLNYNTGNSARSHKSTGFASQPRIESEREIRNQTQNIDTIDKDQEDMPGGSQTYKEYNRRKVFKQIWTARKKAETDAQLLANRIALLQQEQLKSWKKIEDTRKRAKELVSNKEKRDIRMKNKIKMLEMNDKYIVENQRKVKKLKEGELRSKGKLKAIIDQTKKREAYMQKLVQKELEKDQKQKIILTFMKKKQKSQQLRERLQLSSLRIQKYKENKAKMIYSYKDKKILDENKIKEEREKEVQAMEKIEMELIKQLHNTQKIHDSALDELQSALKMNSEINHEYFEKKVGHLNKMRKYYVGRKTSPDISERQLNMTTLPHQNSAEEQEVLDNSRLPHKRAKTGTLERKIKGGNSADILPLYENNYVDSSYINRQIKKFQENQKNKKNNIIQKGGNISYSELDGLQQIPKYKKNASFAK